MSGRNSEVVRLRDLTAGLDTSGSLPCRRTSGAGSPREFNFFALRWSREPKAWKTRQYLSFLDGSPWAIAATSFDAVIQTVNNS